MKHHPGAQAPKKIKPGTFPFPLTNGPEETRYLTWLRNHSNYMLQNGLTDYLRIIAALVRGIFLNFLILLPYLLVAGAAQQIWDPLKA